jgi:hypothetical protein
MALKGSTRHIADHRHVISIRLPDVGLAIEVELILCIRGGGVMLAISWLATSIRLQCALNVKSVAAEG